METLLNYEAEVRKTRLKCEGYEEDVSLADTNPATAWANTGLKVREAKFNASAVVRLIGRLHSDLWHQEKLIPLASSSMFNWYLLDRHSSSRPQHGLEMQNRCSTNTTS